MTISSFKNPLDLIKLKLMKTTEFSQAILDKNHMKKVVSNFLKQNFIIKETAQCIICKRNRFYFITEIQSKVEVPYEIFSTIAMKIQ